jgi:nucleoside phosphorylase
MATCEKKLEDGSYTVGWICNSPIELAAATIMLDERHADPLVHTGDQNTYTLGRIQGHNVVLACLPSGASGDAAAATVEAHMRLTFGAIRFHLMPGIGEGVPNEDDDIRVGDIVVSRPTDSFGGVIRYDRGVRDGDRLRYTGTLNKPPPELLTALSKLQADHEMGERKDIAFLSSAVPRQPDGFQFQGRQKDLLFQSDYDHIRTEKTCRDCDNARLVKRDDRYNIRTENKCRDCDNARLVKRDDRYTDDPKIHYGLIAFGNQPVNDGRTRDQVRQNHKIYCIDTGAAGLMDNTPCLVIRGIWSYADSHKNEQWQGYAAVAAAAYAKELLSVTSVTRQGSSFADTVPYLTSVINNPTPTITLNTGTSSRPSKDSPEALSDWLTMKSLDLRNFPAIPEFIERQEILNDLWNCFSSAGNSPMRKVAVLYGLGGIGKTQLAIHFARLHQNDFTRIFWVNGKSQKTLVDSLAEIEIPDSSVDPVNDVQKKAERVLRWFAIKGNSRWLLIFDDVDQYATSKINNEEAYDVNSYFPTADHGSIIITTRLRKLQELGQPFLVPKLNEKDSMLLMKDIGHTPEEKQGMLTSDLEFIALIGIRY